MPLRECILLCYDNALKMRKHARKALEVQSATTSNPHLHSKHESTLGKNAYNIRSMYYGAGTLARYPRNYEKAGKAAVKEAPTFVMTAPSVF